MKILENYSLQKHNTFRIDVKAKRFIEYADSDELKLILSNPELNARPLFHIGGGSNLLFTKDFDGTILHSAIKYIEVENETDDYADLKVGAGVIWDDVVIFCTEKDWRGAENLSLIPGETGAAAVQNIGAYGAEIKNIIRKTDAVDIETGKELTFENKDCRYAYRSSIFKNELKNKAIITNVYFRLPKNIPFNVSYGTIEAEAKTFGEITAENIRKAVISIRESKLPDPNVTGNAGSFFVNPVIDVDFYRKLLHKYPEMPHYQQSSDSVKIPAGWLIEQCGWKGKQIGNAAVHNKQALVLVNKGNATGDEILNLSKMIQQSVNDKFGIKIDPEVNIL